MNRTDVVTAETTELRSLVNETSCSNPGGGKVPAVYHHHVEVAEMLHGVEIATEGFRHMEEIGQHRLHNFLVGNTILLLGWATLFEIGNRPEVANGPETAHSLERAIVLVIFAVLSALLSFLWTILGLRERKFLALQMGIVCELENLLWYRSKVDTLKITDRICALQKRTKVKIPVSGKEIRLSWVESKMKSRNLAVVAPFVFGLASLGLVALTIRWSPDLRHLLATWFSG